MSPLSLIQPNVSQLVLEQSLPSIFGHRGTGGSGPGTFTKNPENSFCSIQDAIEAGTEGVELDVWLTKDNEIIVVHGCGHDFDGYVHDTWFMKGEFSPNCAVENYTLDEIREKFGLRCSWRGTRNDLTDEDVIKYDFVNSPENQTYYELRECVTCPHNDEFADHSSIPTLKQLFDRFARTPENLERERITGRRLTCSFQVELKGNRADLGPAVVQLAKLYPHDTISRISSFFWYPPTAASPLEDACTNGRYFISDETASHIVKSHQVSCDLIGPIAKNELNIPVALLLTGGAVPNDLEELAVCMQKYKSSWLHTRFDFWRFSAHAKELFDSHDDQEFKKKYPTIQDIQVLQGTPEDVKNVLGLPTTKRFISFLGQNGVKTMFYWSGHGRDFVNDYSLAFDAGVHSICPNEVVMAIDARNTMDIMKASPLASLVGGRLRENLVVVPATTPTTIAASDPSPVTPASAVLQQI